MNIPESLVDAVLKSEDIESLFQHGAPGDEYSGETRKIVSAIASVDEKELDEDRLTNVVSSVWVHSFGPFSADEIEMRMPAFRQVAHRILSANA
jgi:hypothetical protein